ncbi:aminotransferase class I/II-fold pyridoxal phosphate-dependent enzyme [Salibacter halophilus]|uniref:Aminotransferase class I/II-fold pyridoxal phosphate-dependent enzyme n=1 Tax=Salibacter halophilus TaxID=1803916 RepID=A0A6N6M560_9FLAO|nr:aminotransferase class I/II-fold pyridoxal phosphate-dependent enzyme [Salibacter halophilus]KAB1064749.1 aminotransferase class I/II-fold pyridoxal phosphate-dependent enzyme [Salibacter halophilus]
MAKDFDPATELQNIQNFGEFGGVNPSITDSSTYTFLEADRMEEVFEHEIEGCYLYSRHWNPTNRYLADALAKMEGTEAAQVMGSGMGAITSTLLQLCDAGDEIIASRTIYGGTYAFLKNYLPKFNISVKFVDVTDLKKVEEAVSDKTKIIYCEALSNPLLEVADIPALSKISKKAGTTFIVDNTFTPMIISPAKLGADIVVHSLTKFINGTSDAVAGAVCASKEFIDSIMDVNSGSAMLLGPTLDSLRSASILKNIRSLHLRMMQHSRNAMYLAKGFQELGLKVRYPGLKDHPQHELLKQQYNEVYGFGGMLFIDAGSKEKAYELMEYMQNQNVGYLAVSLGFYKTLFSAPGSSTSSELSDEEQKEMGLSDGIVRMSVGLDMDIESTFDKMTIALKEANLI